MADTLTPWSTAKPLFGPLPTWMPDPLDQARIAAYALYESIYANVGDSFKLIQRGTDSQPIYLPNAKSIIEATHRYLAVGVDFYVDTTTGTSQSQAAAQLAFKDLFKREEMYAKLATQKRYGLIRGDQVWHVVGNPLKEEGKRLSIYEVDPAAYFPIEDPDQPGRIIGCHLVTQMEDAAGKTTIRRRTYRKDPANGRITTELTVWEVGKWDDRDPTRELKKVATPDPLRPLDPRITSIPVYHIKNGRTPEDPFGRSEISGLERIMGAVNQAVSDNELALAMAGLGVYWTNSGPPVDENNDETNWQLGPARVVELDPDSTFGRVNGVASVEPVIQHLNYITDSAYESVSIPDVARGRVDVQTAESGIALYLKMAPLLAKNGEKEQEMLPKLDHMIYDLATMWFPVYEGYNFGDTLVGVTVGDPMPQNRKAKIDEILALFTAKLVSAAWARIELGKLGYDFPTDIDTQIVTETTAIANATAGDAFTSRVNEELSQ